MPEYNKNKIEKWSDEFEDIGKEYGAKKEKSSNYLYRKNLNEKDKPFFGFISKGNDEFPNEASGPFSDLCCVVFPGRENEKSVIAFAVGSQKYINDYDIVSKPGIRRMFLLLKKHYQNQKEKNDNKNIFVKYDFCDLETKIKNDLNIIIPEESLAKETIIDSYSNVILAFQTFDDFDDQYSNTIIRNFVAIYSKIRMWPSNNEERKKVDNVMKNLVLKEDNEIEEIKQLLKTRKYVVLQGPPGTGKTYTVRKLGKINENRETVHVFTQFHAETSYGDFIYCLRPDTNSNEELRYKGCKGPLIKAIDEAKDGTKDVILIIDEINRANLSNVLGECFYLFEQGLTDSNIKINLIPNENNKDQYNISALPSNLYVIATMNTSDRSIAVVDFALRRRFAWYTMEPHEITVEKPKKFLTEQFQKINEIFFDYATDEELNLQPGQSYFIANSDDEKEKYHKIKYELLPLIKEYLSEGMLQSAKQSFSTFFYQEIGEELFF